MRTCIKIYENNHSNQRSRINTYLCGRVLRAYARRDVWHACILLRSWPQGAACLRASEQDGGLLPRPQFHCRCFSLDAHIHVCMLIHMYIHIYTHVHTHTYTCTYAYIHTDAKNRVGFSKGLNFIVQRVLWTKYFVLPLNPGSLAKLWCRGGRALVSF